MGDAVGLGTSVADKPSDGVHLYLVPPEARRRIEYPSQMETSASARRAVTRGKTVTLISAVAEQLPEVMITL
ncbi:hypothetical protein D3C72_2527650 [compost metagenome]